MTEDTSLSVLLIKANLDKLDVEGRDRLLKYLDVWYPCGKGLSMFPGISDVISIGAIYNECVKGYLVEMDMLNDIAYETSGGKFNFGPLVHIAMISSAISKEEIVEFIGNFFKNYTQSPTQIKKFSYDLREDYTNSDKLPLVLESLDREINRQKLLNIT